MRRRVGTSRSGLFAEVKPQSRDYKALPLAEKQGTLQDYPLLANATYRIGNVSGANACASTLNLAANGQSSRAVNTLLQLQRRYGNRHVQRILALSRQNGGNAEVALELEQAIQRAHGNGQALDSNVRAQMEPAFGSDLSNVRVHTGAETDTLNRALGARAFTAGQDIFFSQGEYNPGSSSGRELLAHELTHVVQQSGEAVQGKLSSSQPGETYEQEANQKARTVMRKLTRQGADAGQTRVGSEETFPQQLVLSASPANVVQRLPAAIWGSKTARVSTPPDLIQSHLAQDTEIAVSGVSWSWVWASEWNIYDASDQVIASKSSWKYPDFTLEKDVVKKGTPSDGKGNPWTARFEVTKTGKPFGGDDPDEFPWGEAHFHVYASPIANAKFDKKEEIGNQVLAIDKIEVGEGETGEYSVTASGSETRTDSSSVTITNTAKISGEREASVSLEYEGIGGGLKEKIGFEASRSIAKMTGETLSQTQTLTRTLNKKNLAPGTHTFYLRPVFLVLSGTANVLSQNKGVVSKASETTGSIRIWKGYSLEAK